MSLLDDLRRLSAVLPPTSRVSSGEVADILSAAVAHSEFGEDILKAADEGAQSVVDFYHDHISSTAPDGADEPVKGNPVQAVPAAGTVPPAPAGGVSQSDFQKLVKLVEDLVQRRGSDPAPTQPDQPDLAAEQRPSPPPGPSGGSAETGA